MIGHENRKYLGIPVGITVRRQIAKTFIYRVRRGRGLYDEVPGETIQDRYAYFVPDSINNAEGQHARDIFTLAVAAWQALAEATKTWWRQERRRLRLKMSGYNLFIRIYMEDNL